MDHLDRIHDKITKIEVTLGQQHQELKDHIRRTALLEIQTEQFKKLVYKMDGGVKVLFALLTIIEIISKLWH